MNLEEHIERICDELLALKDMSVGLENANAEVGSWELVNKLGELTKSLVISRLAFEVVSLRSQLAAVEEVEGE